LDEPFTRRPGGWAARSLGALPADAHFDSMEKEHFMPSLQERISDLTHRLDELRRFL
jgi:hypothetical protein